MAGYKRLSKLAEFELRQAAIQAVRAYREYVDTDDLDVLRDAMTGLLGAVNQESVEHESSIEIHPTDGRKRAACTCGFRSPWMADDDPMGVHWARDTHALAYEDEGAK